MLLLCTDWLHLLSEFGDWYAVDAICTGQNLAQWHIVNVLEKHQSILRMAGAEEAIRLAPIADDNPARRKIDR